MLSKRSLLKEIMEKKIYISAHPRDGGFIEIKQSDGGDGLLRSLITTIGEDVFEVTCYEGRQIVEKDYISIDVIIRFRGFSF